jgi:taurine--2-oxoglutarate transaminase
MQKLVAYLKSQHLYAFTRFNMLWVCPPLVITEQQLAEGLNVIEDGLKLIDEIIRPTGSDVEEDHAAIALTSASH